MVEKLSKRGEPGGYITYDDIIALALAKTQLTEFTADSDVWQSALHEVQESFKEKIEALSMMFFDTSRPAIPPQSQEFYELISVLSESDLISLPNPTFQRIVMDDNQREKVHELEDELLVDYQEDIDGIANILKEKLRYTP